MSTSISSNASTQTVSMMFDIIDESRHAQALERFKAGAGMKDAPKLVIDHVMQLEIDPTSVIGCTAYLWNAVLNSIDTAKDTGKFISISFKHSAETANELAALLAVSSSISLHKEGDTTIAVVTKQGGFKATKQHVQKLAQGHIDMMYSVNEHVEFQAQFGWETLNGFR